MFCVPLGEGLLGVTVLETGHGMSPGATWGSTATVWSRRGTSFGGAKAKAFVSVSQGKARQDRQFRIGWSE